MGPAENDQNGENSHPVTEITQMGQLHRYILRRSTRYSMCDADGYTVNEDQMDQNFVSSSGKGQRPREYTVDARHCLREGE